MGANVGVDAVRERQHDCRHATEHGGAAGATTVARSDRKKCWNMAPERAAPMKPTPAAR